MQGPYTIKKLTFWLINKKCRADCGKPFRVGDEIVRLEGSYRGRWSWARWDKNKIYHRDCYTDAHGARML